MNSALTRIRKIQSYLDEQDLLRHQGKLPFWHRSIHFWALVFRSFGKNRGPVRAAALAYTTLLALIPFLALVVSLTTGLLQAKDKATTAEALHGFVDRVIDYVAPQLNLLTLSDKPEVQTADLEERQIQKEISRRTVVNNIMEYIERINSGTLGVTAGLVLVFVAISLLSTVEKMFNDMWGVSRGRTWFARIVQYWATISLGPLFIFTALGLTTTGQLASSQQWILRTPLGAVLVKLVPFIVLTIFLTLFYRLMPATKVKWYAAGAGGLVGGVLLQLNNLFSVIYISKVVNYSKVYGGLSVVPIFLLGMYFSWLIVLFGAQVAYAYQNRMAYVQERQAETINQRGREFIALRLMTAIAQAFYHGHKPPTRIELSTSLGVPSQLACQVLGSLVSSRLLVEVSGEELGYLPGRPIDKMTVEDVLQALRVGHGTELSTTDDPERAMLREEYERVLLAEMHAAGAMTVQNLVVRAEAIPRDATNA